MIRHQLAVYSPIAPRGLTAALPALARGGDAAAARVRPQVERLFGARAAALTDSGTSALVLALRMAAGEGGTVAYPGYACVDLAAAARFAGVRVRLYDVDPQTLSPDLDSLRRTLERGADAVLVAHLFGYPADVPGVVRVAAEFGARVIEDAAQGAGGTLDGVRLGGLAPLAVLSFGRGKGTTGGAGGALLANDDTWAAAVHDAGERLAPAGRGVGPWVKAAAQWALGRPTLYRIPASIPQLNLGVMVYHPAHEPCAIPASAAALLRDALRRDAAEVAIRRRTATRYELALGRVPGIGLVRAIPGGVSGYLRYAALASGVQPAPALGVVRAYPCTMAEMPELRPALHEGEREQTGALAIRRVLLGLPTHRFVEDRDVGRVTRHLAGTAGDVTAGLAAARP